MVLYRFEDDHFANSACNIVALHSGHRNRGQRDKGVSLSFFGSESIDIDHIPYLAKYHTISYR